MYRQRKLFNVFLHFLIQSLLNSPLPPFFPTLAKWEIFSGGQRRRALAEGITSENRRRENKGDILEILFFSSLQIGKIHPSSSWTFLDHGNKLINLRWVRKCIKVTLSLVICTCWMQWSQNSPTCWAISSHLLNLTKRKFWFISRGWWE